MSPGNIVARLKDRWSVFNQTQKIISVLVAVGLVVCLAYLGQLLMRPSYAPLFSGLEPKEAGVIVEKLKSMKIPYQLTDQGKTIKVPENVVYDTRIQLASSGLLAGGGAGFELFDQNKFGQTDFEQQVGYQRALQEELRRTIVQLEGVEQARVHLVIPKKSVFISDQGNPSASVALKLKPSARLKPEQVQGISDLLVGSIEGLKQDNVHIIDTEGNILSDNLKRDNPAAVMTRAALDQQKAQREYEIEVEKRIQQMLSRIMGQGKAVAMVTAELDFSQQQTTTSTSTNPDNIKSSEHIIKEEGRGSQAGGAPGTDSNVTTTPFALGGTSDYSREESTTNYQPNTRQETLVKAPGGLRRQSVSVVVNEAAGPAEVQKIRDVVAAAIGYDEARGDQINVSSMVFDNSFQDKLAQEMAQHEAKALERERVYTYAMIGGALLLLILVLTALFIMRRRTRRKDEDVESEEIVPVRAKDIEGERLLEKQVKDTRQNQIREYAKENPEDVAEILKVWIKE